MVKIIGIGEYAISSSEDDIIKTYALGSCVGLVVYNPIAKILGMVHIALPNSNINRDNKNNFLPGYFADTAVPLIFNKVLGGYNTKINTYRVSLYGGANSINSNDVFNVGRKNIKQIQEILIDNHINFDNINTGGYNSRTIIADAKTGCVLINTQPMKI